MSAWWCDESIEAFAIEAFATEAFTTEAFTNEVTLKSWHARRTSRRSGGAFFFLFRRSNPKPAVFPQAPDGISPPKRTRTPSPKRSGQGPKVWTHANMTPDTDLLHWIPPSISGAQAIAADIRRKTQDYLDLQVNVARVEVH